MCKVRCKWAENADDQYTRYHDEEWGVPVHDDRVLFEFLVLEGAQAGLSWSTILKKRENYREAFAGFDPEKVARFDPSRVDDLMNNEGIVRNRMKIESAINNAYRFLDIQDEFGSFDRYIWDFVGNRPKVNRWESYAEVPVTTGKSDEISKDLKRRGFSFVGSTTVYAFMQACGLVNDHTTNCFRHREIILSK